MFSNSQSVSSDQDSECLEPAFAGFRRHHTDGAVPNLLRNELESNLVAALRALGRPMSSGVPGQGRDFVHRETSLMGAARCAPSLFSSPTMHGYGLFDSPASIQIAATDAEPFDSGPPILPLCGQTTVMVKHVPIKYTQRKLLREIMSDGFQGCLDFIYLPMDPRSRANRGFAFVNLDLPETAERFYQTYHGKCFRCFEAEKPLEVSAAELQGFEANAEHHLSTKAARKGRDAYSRPLFLRALPMHLQQQVQQHHEGSKEQSVKAVSAKGSTSPGPLPAGEVQSTFGTAQARGQKAGQARSAVSAPLGLPPMPFKLLQSQSMQREEMFCGMCGLRKDGAMSCSCRGMSV
eukprot:gb/GFBE01026166.1/.p1 GENE.gb/GFBE01026166.1/~~gb/GFBE01026166.1/.p1  ORF type:complete len:349 (+),score=26.44 gb/GFBE01026166.1/:1-1047(+)